MLIFFLEKRKRLIGLPPKDWKQGKQSASSVQTFNLYNIYIKFVKTGEELWPRLFPGPVTVTLWSLVATVRLPGI